MANNNNNNNIRYLLAIILIISITLIIIDTIIKPCNNNHSCISIGIDNFIDWLKDNVIFGAFLLMILYSICVVFCIPGSLLTIGAGSSFGQALGIGYGVLVGSISVFLGASIGAICSFLLGKYLLYDYVNKLIKRFNITLAIDKSIESQELKIMILLRLSPLVPFSALNYVMSGTSMRLRSYSLALFAMLPATIIYVYIGASVSEIVATGTSTLEKILLIVGSITTFLTILFIAWLAKQQLDKIEQEELLERASDKKSELT